MAANDGGLRELVSLDGVFQLLAAHEGFRVARVRCTRATGNAYWLGRVITRARLLVFGAEFSRSLTLVYFRLRQEGPSAVTLEIQWHAAAMPRECSVFIHFLDEAGEIRFQGDYALRIEEFSWLGFSYSRRRVEMPDGIPRGLYRVRLGLWSPQDAVHLSLTRFRGCTREWAESYRNAVILGTCRI
jgi:hypothetical protein